jgi:hypothetical protein
MMVNAATGKPILRRRSRPKPEVSDAEHTERRRRVLSIDCPKCGAAAMHACPGGGRSCSARWDAYYQQAGTP